jgi:hypothetical protein
MTARAHPLHLIKPTLPPTRCSQSARTKLSDAVPSLRDAAEQPMKHPPPYPTRSSPHTHPTAHKRRLLSERPATEKQKGEGERARLRACGDSAVRIMGKRQAESRLAASGRRGRKWPARRTPAARAAVPSGGRREHPDLHALHAFRGMDWEGLAGLAPTAHPCRPALRPTPPGPAHTPQPSILHQRPGIGRPAVTRRDPP